MPPQGDHFLTPFRIPDAHFSPVGPVTRLTGEHPGAGQPVAVGAKGNVVYGTGVPREGEQLPALLHVPDAHRLVKRGWLKAEWGISEANQRARYYRLTAAGKAQLLRERDRWSQLVHAIGRIMNPTPAGEE